MNRPKYEVRGSIRFTLTFVTFGISRLRLHICTNKRNQRKNSVPHVYNLSKSQPIMMNLFLKIVVEKHAIKETGDYCRLTAMKTGSQVIPYF